MLPFISRRLYGAIYYSCETCLTGDLRSTETYTTMLKHMTGVRLTTCNDLILIELGLESSKAYILQRQSRYLHKLKEREGFQNSYVKKGIDMTIEAKCTAGKCLTRSLRTKA